MIPNTSNIGQGKLPFPAEMKMGVAEVWGGIEVMGEEMGGRSPL